jgi:hypothetical protein
MVITFWILVERTVLGVLDGAVLDVDLLNGIVRASTDGADGDTVATSALGSGEGDVLGNFSISLLKSHKLRCAYSAGVDSQAIILVVNHGVGDVDTGAGTDVESIGVVATLAITVGVVNSDSIHSKAICIVDAEDLDGGVLDVNALDLGVDHLVGSEELWLSLAAVGSLAIPPARTISIEDGTRSTLDGNVSSGDGDQGTVPFLVAEGGLSLEDDLKNWLVEIFI